MSAGIHIYLTFEVVIDHLSVVRVIVRQWSLGICRAAKYNKSLPVASEQLLGGSIRLRFEVRLPNRACDSSRTGRHAITVTVVLLAADINSLIRLSLSLSLEYNAA